MGRADLDASAEAEAARLSQFAFGLPGPETEPQSKPASRDAGRRPGTPRADKPTAGEVAVALLILGAAVLGSLGMKPENFVKFPQVAAVLRAAPAPEKPVDASTADARLKVWADLNTALYYCPGSVFYGRTRNGHFLSQADAQSGHFEAAEGRQCRAESSATSPGGRLARR